MVIRPLLIAAALAALATPALAQDAQTLTISMSNYAFTPSTLNLRAGQPYALVFTNTVTKDHDFVAPELFASGTIAPADQAKVVKGAVEVDDGGSVTVHFTPGKPGTYAFTCDHFMHAMLGMKGTAIVQ